MADQQHGITAEQMLLQEAGLPHKPVRYRPWVRKSS